MINKMWCMELQEQEEVLAYLEFAKRLNLIEDASIEAVEKRRNEMNKKIKHDIENGEIVYGLTHYSFPAYLQYELTRFRLDFVSGKINGDYIYKNIKDEDIMKYYRENLNLFTRYEGDIFPYEDVKIIIEKRIREEEYHDCIQKILCEQFKRK